MRHLNDLKTQIEQKQFTINSLQEEKTVINSDEIGKTYLEIVQLLRTPFIKSEKMLAKPGLATPRPNEVEDPSFLHDSILAKTEGDKIFIYQWLEMEKPITKLLYKASRDGFSAEKFHELCDHKGPTLTIYKSS